MSVTRRTFAFSLAAAATAAGQTTPIRRFLDPSTEIEVFALSDPELGSYLTHHYNRSVSSRGGFIVYTRESTQGLQAVRVEIKGGATRVITSATDLHRKSLALSPDDRTLYFADGANLLAVPIGGGKPREVFTASSPQAFHNGLSLSEDGASFTLIDNGKLMLIPAVTKLAPKVLAEIGTESTQPAVSRTGQVFVLNEGGIVLVNGGKAEALPIDAPAGPASWNPDGRSILYLRKNSLWEYSLDTKKEALVGKTSQFVHFGRNADSSVFVGASGSKAQPFVLLMLRVTRRELALCEHKASDAMQVAPVFSPNSQRVFFQSDRLGKPAIFSVVVDRLVESTERDEKSSAGSSSQKQTAN